MRVLVVVLGVAVGGLLVLDAATRHWHALAGDAILLAVAASVVWFVARWRSRR